MSGSPRYLLIFLTLALFPSSALAHGGFDSAGPMGSAEASSLGLDFTIIDSFGDGAPTLLTSMHLAAPITEHFGIVARGGVVQFNDHAMRRTGLTPVSLGLSSFVPVTESFGLEFLIEAGVGLNALGLPDGMHDRVTAAAAVGLQREFLLSSETTLTLRFELRYQLPLYEGPAPTNIAANPYGPTHLHPGDPMGTCTSDSYGSTSPTEQLRGATGAELRLASVGFEPQTVVERSPLSGCVAETESRLSWFVGLGFSIRPSNDLSIRSAFEVELTSDSLDGGARQWRASTSVLWTPGSSDHDPIERTNPN